MEERTAHRYATFLIVGCMLFCAGHGYLSLREYLAEDAAHQRTLAGLLRAARLSPQNADYQDQLGMALLFLQNDGKGAQQHLAAATALNPHNSRYWLDLGRLHQATGNSTAADRAADRAVLTGGTYGWVLWESGLLYVSAGDHEKALRHFHRALDAEAIPAERVVDLCWRTTEDVESMLTLLLPTKPAAYKALLNTLVHDNRRREADLAWQQMLTVGQDFPPDTSFSYIDYLLRHRRPADAADAWRLFAARNSMLRPYIASDNLVENGGFELDLLNGGFDWRYTSRNDALVSLATDRVHSGQRSLKLSFRANQLWDGPILQYIPVKPGTTYRITAHLTAENIRTISGPRIRIRDALTGTDYVLTNEFTGSSPWITVENAFTTGPAAYLATLAVVRSPGHSSISGNLWLDDLSLREVR